MTNPILGEVTRIDEDTNTPGEPVSVGRAAGRDRIRLRPGLGRRCHRPHDLAGGPGLAPGHGRQHPAGPTDGDSRRVRPPVGDEHTGQQPRRARGPVRASAEDPDPGRWTSRCRDRLRPHLGRNECGRGRPGRPRDVRDAWWCWSYPGRVRGSPRRMARSGRACRTDSAPTPGTRYPLRPLAIIARTTSPGRRDAMQGGASVTVHRRAWARGPIATLFVLGVAAVTWAVPIQVAGQSSPVRARTRRHAARRAARCAGPAVLRPDGARPAHRLSVSYRDPPLLPLEDAPRT